MRALSVDVTERPGELQPAREHRLAQQRHDQAVLHRFHLPAPLEQAALAALRKKSPDRPLETNVEFWSAVVLDIAEIPPPLFPAMFAAARVAGWSAHILEQKRTGRLIRPSALYVGPPARSLASVD